jgi:propionyl-CoA carboxylase beta chain
MDKPVDPDPRRALLDARDAEAEQGGGEARVARQHREGKLTARERLGLLLDPGSFVEIDKLRAPGVVTGHGQVEGRPVFVFAQDFTVSGGSITAAVAEKICKVMDKALEVGCPIVGLEDSGGARIQEGVAALAGYASIFQRHVRASGVVPQLSLVMGPCAGSAVYGPATTDFTFMVRPTAAMFLSGPEAIAAATGEQVTLEALGGADAHATRSGLAHFVHDGDEAALKAARELLGFLPLNNAEEPPLGPQSDDPARRDEALRALVPEDTERPYDAREVVRAVADDRHLLEVSAAFAPNVVTGFVRLDGRPAGVVANQPAAKNGALDGDAAVKAARFVRTCDAFGLPLLTFVDVPGFLPGTAQEWGGLARHGAKLLYAYAEATVPKLTVITRRAWGGAYGLMASKHLGADVCLAWPSAEIAVLPPEAAVGVVFRKELAAAKDPVAEKARLVAEYREQHATPYRAAELGYLDAVIKPEETRPRLVRALSVLRTKRQDGPPRKHGNIPL